MFTTTGQPHGAAAAYRRAAVLLLLALPAGCAKPTQPYNTPPTGQPSARLLMRGTVSGGDKYGIYLYDDAERCQGPRQLGIGVADRHPPATRIAAGKLATVDVVFAKPNRSFCRVAWSFVPKAGRSYLVSAGLAGNVCLALIQDATDPDAIKPEAGALRRDRPNLRCLPLAESRPIAGLDRPAGQAVLPPAPIADAALEQDLKKLLGP